MRYAQETSIVGLC